MTEQPQIKPTEGPKNVNMPPLPVKGPETVRLPGEITRLREPRPGDPKEIAQFVKIENGGAMGEVNETLEDSITPEEMPGWLGSLAERPHVTMKTIVLADPKEGDVAQGWFRIDQGTPVEGEAKAMERSRFERINGQVMGENELDPAELTYIAAPDSKTPGLLDSAVINGIGLIEARDKAQGGDHPPRTVVVFQEPPTPDTQEAYDALAKCGFEQRTKELVRYDEEDGGEPDTHMYVLNWDKYHQIAAERAQAASQKEDAALDAARAQLTTEMMVARHLKQKPVR